MIFKKKYSLLIIPAIIILFACNSPYTSKTSGYFQIDFPAHNYKTFDSLGFPYSFDYPTYATIAKDSTYFDNSEEGEYWVNVDFPQYNARIFLSYKAIGGRALYKIPVADGTYRDSIGINHFDKMVNDAYKLTSKNDVVASSIKDSLFLTENGVSGVLFKVGGNAATATQFYLTDSTKNFLRGALYFSATPNSDSIKPVQAFINLDINRFLQSFKWK